MTDDMKEETMAKRLFVAGAIVFDPTQLDLTAAVPRLAWCAHV